METKQTLKLSEVRKVLTDGTAESLRNYTFILSQHDSALANHGLNVASFASLLAQRAGFSQFHTDIIWLAGLLHDIGKLFISSSILSKTTTLTPAEWDVIRQHSRLGCEVLSTLNWAGTISKLVRGHHERWDGKGYPDGLRGEQIEPGARILAVADTLDAMTSNRSYRLGMSFEAARAQIAAASGTQFDPTIVNIMLTIPEQEWRSLQTEPNPRPWCVPNPVTLARPIGGSLEALLPSCA
jgi:putative nucleotidyltransferase with HDIG domain